MYRRRNEQLVEAKTSYFTKKVEESKGNPKALFRLTRNMMGNSGETILPLHTCRRNLANDFSAFFYNKILAAWLKNSPTVESFKVNLKTYLFCERFLS